MEEWTFENADMSNTVMHRAKKYVDNWEEIKEIVLGCLLGTGWYREKFYCGVHCQ